MIACTGVLRNAEAEVATSDWKSVAREVHKMVPLEATIALVDVMTPKTCQAAAEKAVPTAASAATKALAPMEAALGPLGNTWTAVATPWIFLTAVTAPETEVPSTKTNAGTATARATSVAPGLRIFKITWRFLSCRAARRVREVEV